MCLHHLGPSRHLNRGQKLSTKASQGRATSWSPLRVTVLVLACRSLSGVARGQSQFLAALSLSPDRLRADSQNSTAQTGAPACAQGLNAQLLMLASLPPSFACSLVEGGAEAFGPAALEVLAWGYQQEERRLKCICWETVSL